MVKHEAIYADSKDLNICKVVLYAHSDNILYYDKVHKNAVTRAELMDLLKKGLALIFDTDSYYFPLFFKDEGTEVKVTIATAIGSGTSTSKELKSKADSE